MLVSILAQHATFFTRTRKINVYGFNFFFPPKLHRITNKSFIMIEIMIEKHITDKRIILYLCSTPYVVQRKMFMKEIGYKLTKWSCPTVVDKELGYIIKINAYTTWGRTVSI